MTQIEPEKICANLRNLRINGRFFDLHKLAAAMDEPVLATGHQTVKSTDHC
jgi:hypothetical protein